MGIKLPKQTVQIFNCAFLPGAIWVGKIDFTMESFFNLKSVVELFTPVAGNGLDQSREKAASAATIAFSIASAFRPGVFTAM